MLQAESVRDAALGCEWVGTPVPFVRSLCIIINMANKEIVLTAGKFVPVSKATMMNVRHCLTCLQVCREPIKPPSVWPSVCTRHLRICERIFRNSLPENFSNTC